MYTAVLKFQNHLLLSARLCLHISDILWQVLACGWAKAPTFDSTPLVRPQFRPMRTLTDSSSSASWPSTAAATTPLHQDAKALPRAGFAFLLCGTCRTGHDS